MCRDANLERNRSFVIVAVFNLRGHKALFRTQDYSEAIYAVRGGAVVKWEVVSKDTAGKGRAYHCSNWIWTEIGGTKREGRLDGWKALVVYIRWTKPQVDLADVVNILVISVFGEFKRSLKYARHQTFI